MKTKEFTLSEREELSRLLVQDQSFTAIAKQLNKDKGTISREVHRRGMDRKTYRAHKAHWHARRQKKKQGRKRKIEQNPVLKKFVMAKLRLRWSPAQIAVKLERLYAGDKSMQISHETIYSYIYVLPRGSLKKELLNYLRQQKKYRRRKNKNQPRENQKQLNRGQIPEMISIEERPREVLDRIVPGHWEGDLILGKWKQSALGTIVERTTRTTLLVPLGKDKDAETVRKAFAHKMKTLPAQMKLSLTYDQGKEMSEHKLFTKKTQIKVYFAHPGCPWERGTNENTNGLIRQFFPKGTDFNKVSKREINKVQQLLNGRPRKVLDYQTPYEVFGRLINNMLQ
ncbi:MAG: IS30 family transposase [Candidatus Doudnabacteria bacterium]